MIQLDIYGNEISLEDIKKASLEELEQLDGMNSKIAQEIIDFFNNRRHFN